MTPQIRVAIIMTLALMINLLINLHYFCGDGPWHSRTGLMRDLCLVLAAVAALSIAGMCGELAVPA